MKRCLIIGGGFAGLSTAVNLSEKNLHVNLIEASPKLGGRAYSLQNDKFADTYDNGQHILMGCYYETINFLKKINAIDKLEYQDSLQINFVDTKGKTHKLKSPRYFYPFNLLWGIMNYTAVSFKSRLKIVDFFLDLMCCFDEDFSQMNVADWLNQKKQTNESIKAFWELLGVSALNTTLQNASAEMFAEVLKRIFLDGSKAAAILIPKVGLSDLFVEPSVEFIANHSGEVSTSERALKFIIEDGKIKRVITDKNEYDDFDFVISAIPTHALKKIEFVSNDSSTSLKPVMLITDDRELEYSSILNVHLWVKNNPFQGKFYGLIDSKIHWVFNHGKHISITTSDFKVVKEKRATFIPDSRASSIRKMIGSPLPNFVLAGDWIDTGLPSTIESAVLSGKLAAEKILFSTI